MADTTVRADGHALHFGDRLTIVFESTLRIPDNAKAHNLPPGLGSLPVHSVHDYAGKVPQEWLDTGGVFVPLDERRATWLSFQSGWNGRWAAVQVAVGGVNALTGEKLVEGIEPLPAAQTYLEIPTQPWLDGIKTGPDEIGQFVAVKKGTGYSVEAQVTGSDKHGGMQIIVYPPKPDREPKNPRRRIRFEAFGLEASGAGTLGGEDTDSFGEYVEEGLTFGAGMLGGDDGLECLGPPVRRRMSSVRPSPTSPNEAVRETTLGRGGRMKQTVYEATLPRDTWDLTRPMRCWVRFVDGTTYQAITGLTPPPMPPDAHEWYKANGIMFDLEGGPADLPTPDALANVKSVAEKDKEHGFTGQQNDADTAPSPNVVQIQHPVKPQHQPGVAEHGNWGELG